MTQVKDYINNYSELELPLTMMEVGFEIQGLKLDSEAMRAIHRYYCVASTQEYLVENFKITNLEAALVADRARTLQEEACAPVWDCTCCKEAARELNIKLITREGVEES